MLIQKCQNDTIRQNLEFFGTQYREKYLSKWIIDNLKSNSLNALQFFLSHSFMRGRNDNLSTRYYDFTIEILSNYFKMKGITNSLNLFKKLKKAKEENLFNADNIKSLKFGRNNSLTHPKFQNVIINNPLIKELTTPSYIQGYKKKISLQNDLDLFMVLDVLNLMAEKSENLNLFDKFNKLIINNRIKEAYTKLVKISGIGDKIATFILRDIILLNNYKLNSKQIEYVFPVDTWVAQITSLMSGKSFSASNTDEIKKYYFSNFPNSNIALIAAGIWFLGYNSLNLIINFVKTIDIKKIVNE